MSKCVECGKETTRPVCAECTRNVLEEADRERIPLIGDTKPAARVIGFVAPVRSLAKKGGA